ncbi:unnamed protein product [Cunninghamella blakesleeana]
MILLAFGFGFDFQLCTEALNKYNDIQKATEWILSNSNDLSNFSFHNSSPSVSNTTDKYQDQQHLEKQREELNKLASIAKKQKIQEKQTRKNILEEFKQDREKLKLLKPKTKEETKEHTHQDNNNNNSNNNISSASTLNNNKDNKDTHQITLQNIQKDIIKQKKLDREARKQILNNIKYDKLEKQKKTNPTLVNETSIKNDHSKVRSSASASSALIQFKLSDGSTIRNSFPNTTTLEHLYEYIHQQESLRGKPIPTDQQILLTSAFPRRTFGHEEANMTVSEAGFIPNVSLNVSINLPVSHNAKGNEMEVDDLWLNADNKDDMEVNSPWSNVNNNDEYEHNFNINGDEEEEENASNDEMEINELNQQHVINPHRPIRRGGHHLQFSRQRPVTEFDWNLSHGHRLVDDDSSSNLNNNDDNNNDSPNHQVGTNDALPIESDQQRRENILIALQNHHTRISNTHRTTSSASDTDGQSLTKKSNIKMSKKVTPLKELCISLMTGIISSSSKDTSRLLKNLQYISLEVANLLIEKLMNIRKLNRLTLSRLIRHCYLQSITLDSYVYATDSLLEEISLGTTLTKISLRGCDLITDAGIKHIENMKYLIYLDTSNCKITDKGFKSITKLKSLQYLNMTRTNITDQGFKWFTTNTECKQTLHTFILTGCKHITSNNTFLQLKEFKNLNNLSLNSTQIGEQTVDGLMKPLSNSLRILDVSLTSITDKDLIRLIGNFGLLKELKLSSCNAITIKGLAQFIGCISSFKSGGGPWLEYIELPNREHEINGLMARLKDVPLRSLDLTGFVNLDDEGVEYISKISKLKSLNLSRTKVTDEGLSLLKNLSYLEELYLDNTIITDQGLLHLTGLRNLSTLSLCGTSVTNEGLMAIGDVEHTNVAATIQYLNLRYCKGISNQGVKAIANMINMTHLNLDHTNVTLQCLQYLKDLKYLNPLRLLGIKNDHDHEDIEMDTN